MKSIEKHLLHESVINKETFDTDTRFVKKGGFKTIDKKFGGHLAAIIVAFTICGIHYGWLRA